MIKINTIYFNNQIACQKHNLVSLELLLFADQGDVAEVFILPQTAESLTDVLLVCVPVQLEGLHFSSRLNLEAGTYLEN